MGCTESYTVNVCQTTIPCSDPADPDPCQNGGICANENDFSDYICTCATDYTGTNCEFPIPCSTMPCLNLGVCVNDVDWSGYECDCAFGWTGDICEDVDQCAGDELEIAFLFQVEEQDGTFE